MVQRRPIVKKTYRFTITSQDPLLNESCVLAAKSATEAKIVEAVSKGGAALCDAFLKGTGTAGEKLFFDKYLSPKLVDLNLLPSKFRPTRAELSSPVLSKNQRGRGRV
jgi:hypothetical protein